MEKSIDNNYNNNNNYFLSFDNNNNNNNTVNNNNNGIIMKRVMVGGGLVVGWIALDYLVKSFLRSPARSAEKLSSFNTRYYPKKLSFIEKEKQEEISSMKSLRELLTYLQSGKLSYSELMRYSVTMSQHAHFRFRVLSSIFFVCFFATNI